MIIVKFKLEAKQFKDFNEMCRITGEDPSSKIKTMIADELYSFQQLQERSKVGKRDGWVEIGVQHTIPLAY